MKVRVDDGLCVGHGRCYELAPRVFGEDEEEITHSECWFDYDYQAQIRRSVVVGDTLYTLSDRGLLSTDLASLEPGELLPFAVG